jgi:hypothetical protein
LYVPARAPWLADFRSELLSFPAGKHDDQVDAIGLIGQLLDKMANGVVPDRRKHSDLPRKRDYFGGFDGDDDEGTDWKVA